MILITGATGTNGREIVKQLSDKGVKIRLMVRRREHAGLAHSSNTEYVIGNFDHFASLGGALAGVERAFLLSPSSAEQVTRESNFIRAAKRAGIHHVVKFSILGAEPDSPSRLIHAFQASDAGLFVQTVQPGICSKLCVLPWRINMTFDKKVNKHKPINHHLVCKTPIHRRRTRNF